MEPISPLSQSGGAMPNGLMEKLNQLKNGYLNNKKDEGSRG
jgi:hypothetical protein